MKRIFILACGLWLTSAMGWAQQADIPYQSTIRIETTDTESDIISKAAHVVPTPNQLAALKREFIAFVHFGPNTFTRREWGTGKEDPKVFNLQSLDTDQWCEAMKAAGMQMVILTVKHHDGFVLWQSRYTRHGIMSSPYQNGKGDVLKELSASCRKYGLKLGIYLSPADLYQIESPDGLYGNLSRYTMRTIPREVPGRPFANKTRFRFMVDDYNEYYLNQLFELLTEYGPISEVWLDGAHPKRKGGQTYNYTAWRKMIRTLAPEAVVFGREDVRWCGNEGGATRPTEWNVIPYQADPDTMQHFADLTAPDLGSRQQLVKGRYLHYQPAETNTSIRHGWFYRDDDSQQVRNADDVFDIYERAVGGNSIFLLNIPPGRDGRLADRDVAVLKETGKRIRDTYTTNLLTRATGAPAVLDDNDTTYVSLPAGSEGLVVSTPEPVTINRLMIQEAVAVRGERVEEHAVDAWIDGGWKEIARATNIGYKRILRFADVTTSRIRLRVLQSRLTPAISSLKAFHYASRPPRLTASRDAEGMVSIQAASAGHFSWNSHGENSVANLNSGFRIYYTTDGTEPTAQSTEYTAPFRLAESAEVRAVAVLGTEQGAVMQERFGLLKSGWSVTPGAEQEMTIRLAEPHRLQGFSFTPQAGQGGESTVAGTLSASTDGKRWTEVGRFDFGNLVNDPTRRYQALRPAAGVRYVRIRSAQVAEMPAEAVLKAVDLY